MDQKGQATKGSQFILEVVQLLTMIQLGAMGCRVGGGGETEQKPACSRAGAGVGAGKTWSKGVCAQWQARLPTGMRPVRAGQWALPG